MKDSALKTYAIMFGFSFVPYAAVAWFWTTYMATNTSWWIAFLCLLAARFFFAFIEFLGSILCRPCAPSLEGRNP